jgi:cysteine desulfurase
MNGIIIHSPKDASPFILNFASPVPSEIMMNSLQSDGYMVSAKSTCSSKETGASHVLMAIGVSVEEAGHTIRVSLQSEVTMNDVIGFADSVDKAIKKFVK